jgi:t-SNARE complex subunit (syntaxin)
MSYSTHIHEHTVSCYMIDCLSHTHLPSYSYSYLFSLYSRTTYAKVAGKYQDVLTLEQSVAELHQMFLDFALLTEQQGELLDQIEFNVTQATDYVEEANVETHTAIEYQKSIRKKQWYVYSPLFYLYYGLGCI